MGGARKVTVELPDDLLRRAQKSMGDGITSTIRRGLELVAAGEAYRGLRRLKGKVSLSIDLDTLRDDREMIAADSSSLIVYLSGATGHDVDAIDRALGDQQLCLPPVVLTELFSDPKLPPQLASVLRQIPLLDPSTGFWERAGRLRSRVLARKRRARLADTLIAQICLDNDLALITRDLDFLPFVDIADLKILAALISCAAPSRWKTGVQQQLLEPSVNRTFDLHLDGPPTSRSPERPHCFTNTCTNGSWPVIAPSSVDVTVIVLPLSRDRSDGLASLDSLSTVGEFNRRTVDLPGGGHRPRDDAAAHDGCWLAR